MGDLLFILVLYFIGRYIKSVTKILKEQKGGAVVNEKPSPAKAPRAKISQNKAQKRSRKDRKTEAAKPAKVAEAAVPTKAPQKAVINVQEDFFSFISGEDAYLKPDRKIVDKKPQAVSESKAAKLFSPKGLAGVVVMSEILDKPLALREEYK